MGHANGAPEPGRPVLGRTRELATPEDSRVGSIVCFLVSPGHRRQGTARRLLEAACSGFVARGLAAAEAYPRKAQHDAATNYEGPMPLYRELGFALLRDCGRFTIVRKAFAPA